jgi:hypothetical protein
MKRGYIRQMYPILASEKVVPIGFNALISRLFLFLYSITDIMATQRFVSLDKNI